MVNFNAPWDQLTHTIVGKSYSPEFYEPIKNPSIRDSLQQIARETEEDYQYLISVLSQFDISVSRPEIDPTLTIMNYVNHHGVLDYSGSKSFTLIPRPPMQPRDSILVVGDQAVATLQESAYYTLPENTITSTQQFDAPLVTVVGKHLIVDCREHAWLGDYMSDTFPDRTIVPVMIGGHNDAVFCPVKPGVIVSTYHHSNYADTFPNWEVKFIENQSWNAIPQWRSYKHANINKWWTPDRDDNPEFAEFVDTWLGNWLGHVNETVFDVNMLQLNERTVLVNNYNKEMFEFFKTHNIEAIVTPFRHRFFWDGGIHCITGDLHRTGEAHEYI
jgi:hypothetical protein